MKRIKKFTEWYKNKFKKVTLRLSDDRTLYYVEEYANAFDFWLSYDKIPGPVPEKQKNGGLFSPHFVEIRHVDKRVWNRRYYPFTFWSISTTLNLRETVPYSDDRVQDYLSIKSS